MVTLEQMDLRVRILSISTETLPGARSMLGIAFAPNERLPASRLLHSVAQPAERTSLLLSVLGSLLLLSAIQTGRMSSVACLYTY